MEERLDKLLVQLNLMESRVQSENFIQNVGVVVNGKLINKPGKKVPVSSVIKLFQQTDEMKTPEGFSIRNVLEKWKIDLTEKQVLVIYPKDDSFVNAIRFKSAGEITYISAQNEFEIASENGVINFSKNSVRELSTLIKDSTIDFVFIHASVYSIFKTIPFIFPLLKAESEIVLLFKPELEATKEELKPNGSFKDYGKMPRFMTDVQNKLFKSGLKLIDKKASEVIGKDGFTEYFLRLKKI